MGSAVAAFAFMATLQYGGEAHADCGLPDFELLWTYPADGDADVPVNAQIWVLTSIWSSAAGISLNGEPLTGVPHGFGGQVIDPGALEADTDYELELRFATGSVSSGAEQVITIAFHTASETADAATAPKAVGHTSMMGHGSHDCSGVVAAQDCFDTGQDTLLTVQMEDDHALGWVIELEERGPAAVWPASCGGPSLYVYGETLPNECVRVGKIGPGGLLSEATRYCLASDVMSDAAVAEPQGDASVPSDRAPDAAAQDDGGCSVTSHLGRSRARDATSFACLGLLALALRARRRARRR